jgi:hypothetical protein
MYKEIVPSMRDVTPIPQCQFILENNRKEIYTTNWGLSKELRRRLLIKIGDASGEFKLADLGIEKGELCFQWFLQIAAGIFIVYPLVEEAHIQEAVKLEFHPETN